MTLKDVSTVTGISMNRLRASVKRGFLVAEFADDGEPWHRYYIIKPDMVYEYARNEWFMSSVAMYPPPEIAANLLKTYGDTMPQQLREKLNKLQHENIAPRSDRPW